MRSPEGAAGGYRPPLVRMKIVVACHKQTEDTRREKAFIGEEVGQMDIKLTNLSSCAG